LTYQPTTACFVSRTLTVRWSYTLVDAEDIVLVVVR